MSRFLPEQYHLVDGKIEDIKQNHPLENLKDKTVFIERFKTMFGDDMEYEDISDGKGKLFRITYQGYEYNLFIEGFDSGGGKNKKKKIGIPSTYSKSGKSNYLKKLLDSYESVLIINEYVPLVRENGILKYSNRSVYGVMKPKELYSSKVIREKTGNASSRWVNFEDMIKCLEEDRVIMNGSDNVYVIPSTKVKSFFDTELIIEQYEEMSKYLFDELKKDNKKDISKLEGSITRIFRNKLIKEREKHLENGSSVKCTCEFCNCGVNIPELLVASHINAKSNIRSDDTLTDDEKFNLMTDIDNGFLLCRTHDALFDKKYITLDKDGKLLISDTIGDLKKEFNIEELSDKVVISNISDETQGYLNQHRVEFYKKINKE